MQFRSIRYPLISLFELIRAVVLLRQGALIDGPLPVTWYAGIPLLAIVPFAFILLSVDENDHASWLPLIALVKFMCAASLVTYAILTFPDAVNFGTSGNLSYFSSMAAAAFFGITDGIIGIYCLRRNHNLCR
jgi:hypothetical protein